MRRAISSFGHQHFRKRDLHGWEEDEHNAIERNLVIDIKQIEKKFKRSHVSRRGYKGLGRFLIFVAGLLYILGLQHQTQVIGKANDTFRNAWELSKVDLTVHDAAGLLQFVAKKAVPLFMQQRWSENSAGPTQEVGYTSMQYFYLLGGVALTVKMSEEKICYDSMQCFKGEMKGGSLKFLAGDTHVELPYVSQYEGYTAFLPATFDSADIAGMMSSLQGVLATKALQELRLNAIFFNPSSEREIITCVELRAVLGPYGSISFYQKAEGLLYYMYGSDAKSVAAQIVVEFGIVLYALYFFIFPLIQAIMLRKEVDLADMQRQMKMQKLWEHFPASKDGDIVLDTPMAMWLVFSLGIFMWCRLLFLYEDLPLVEELNKVYWQPPPAAVANTAGSAAAFEYSKNIFENHFFRFMQTVENIKWWSGRYFDLSLILLMLVLCRFFEYLSFQRKLSIVTDTFRDTSHDLLHIGFVFFVATYTAAVMCCLAFGSEDPSFQHFGNAFIEMIEVCFGLFKPAASSQFNPPLFKYVPHILLMGGEYSWLPEVILGVFKVLAVLLLFKLIIGVIMHSYQRHKPKNSNSIPNLIEDVWELLVDAADFYFFHKILGQPYVAIEYLTMACNSLHKKERTIRLEGEGHHIKSGARGRGKIVQTVRTKHSNENVWKEWIIGLIDGPKEIIDALNACQGSERAQWVFDEFHLDKHFTFADARWCLRKYGSSRAIALQHLEGWYEAHVKSQEAEEKEKEKEGEHGHSVAEGMWQELAKTLGVEHQAVPPKAEIEQAFDSFDVYGVGCIDIRQVDDLLRALGYQLTALEPRDLRKIVAEFDRDENLLIDRAEVDKLIQDKRLRALRRMSTNVDHFKKAAHSVGALRKLRMATFHAPHEPRSASNEPQDPDQHGSHENDLTSPLLSNRQRTAHEVSPASPAPEPKPASGLIPSAASISGKSAGAKTGFSPNSNAKLSQEVAEHRTSPPAGDYPIYSSRSQPHSARAHFQDDVDSECGRSSNQSPGHASHHAPQNGDDEESRWTARDSHSYWISTI